jgi:hypothetical protein
MLKRLGCLLLGLAAMAAVTARMPSAGAAPSAGTILTATISPISLTLSTGETATVSGSLSVTITQFKVQDGKIVAVANLNGTLTGTTSAGDTVTATFTNAKVVLTVSNLQANCSAGTLSFDLRAVIPPSGVEVTVNGAPVSLKKAVVLTGSVTVSTASIADPSVAGRAGALICQLDSLLKSGASLEAIVDKLNQLLRVLA